MLKAQVVYGKQTLPKRALRALTRSPKRAALVVIALILGVTTVFQAYSMVLAATCSTSAECQQKIDQLNGANAQAQSSLNGLQAQASSFQDAINRLQEQINAMQQQVDSNQAQQRAVQKQIDDNQAELLREKNALASDIKAMYVDGQPTTLEMLASSSNLSEFVDKEQYRTNVQDKIQTTMQKIAELQKTLGDQKAQLGQLLQSLQAQQAQLASSQSEKARMLSYNQSQQEDYNNQIKANKQALSELYAKQAAIIAASFGGGIHYGGTGNYPYANAVCLNGSGSCSAYSESPYNWGYKPNRPYDEAGWQYRNCTSYAFWRLAQTTGITLTWASFPAVYNSGGKIKYSVIGGSSSDFGRMGYRIDHDPNGEAVLAVNSNGTFGHIMYVETVVDGKAVVSQYNAAGDGLYSTGTLGASDSIWFVHIR